MNPSTATYSTTVMPSPYSQSHSMYQPQLVMMAPQQFPMYILPQQYMPGYYNMPNNANPLAQMMPQPQFTHQQQMLMSPAPNQTMVSSPFLSPYYALQPQPPQQVAPLDGTMRMESHAAPAQLLVKQPVPIDNMLSPMSSGSFEKRNSGFAEMSMSLSLNSSLPAKDFIKDSQDKKKNWRCMTLAEEWKEVMMQAHNRLNMVQFLIAPAPENNDSDVNLFVRNVDTRVTTAMMRELFSLYGTVVSVNMNYHLNYGLPKGFGFVSMNSYDDARRAFACANRLKVHGRELDISWASRKHDSKQTSPEQMKRYRYLIVRNIPLNASEERIKKVFEEFGQLHRMHVIEETKLLKRNPGGEVWCTNKVTVPSGTRKDIHPSRMSVVRVETAGNVEPVSHSPSSDGMTNISKDSSGFTTDSLRTLNIFLVYRQEDCAWKAFEQYCGTYLFQGYLPLSCKLEECVKDFGTEEEELAYLKHRCACWCSTTVASALCDQSDVRCHEDTAASTSCMTSNSAVSSNPASIWENELVAGAMDTFNGIIRESSDFNGFGNSSTNKYHTRDSPLSNSMM